MTIELRAESDASPERVWELYAQPARWKEWAPHVRSPQGLGEPEVSAGARGRIRLLGALPLPATITAVDPGRAWSWSVGALRLEHTVEAREGGGAVIGLAIDAPRPLEVAIRVTYAPVTRLLLENLASVAARE